MRQKLEAQKEKRRRERVARTGSSVGDGKSSHGAQDESSSSSRRRSALDRFRGVVF